MKLYLSSYKLGNKVDELIDTSVEYCNKHNIKYQTLRDGEVIIKQLDR